MGKHYVVKVTAKGQLTLPSELRDAFGIRTGDRLEFIGMSANEMRVRPLNAAPTAVFDDARPATRDPRFATDDDAIAEAIAERDARIRSRPAAE